MSSDAQGEAQARQDDGGSHDADVIGYKGV